MIEGHGASGPFVAGGDDRALRLFLADENRPTGALVFTTGLVIFLGALLLERLIGARFDRTDGLVVLIVLVPQAIIFQFSAWRRFARRHMSEVAAVVVVADVVLVSLLSTRNTLPTDEWPYVLEYAVLLIVFSYLLSGQVLRHAIQTGIVSLVIYTVMLLALADPSTDAVRRAVFTLAATNGIAAMGRLGIERAYLLRTKQLLDASEAAMQDPLTGIANRRGLASLLERTLAVAARERWLLTIAVLDLDEFKTINDERGHAAGDDVLVQVAAALVASARRPLDIVARLGGDEFVTIWTRVDDEAAQQLPERLLEAVAAIDDRRGRLGASIGCVTFTASVDVDFEDLLRQADDASRAAKAAGGGQVRWHESSSADQITRS